ncbi:hypothetical protein Sm713_36960 [Streptomyces sp. TS71-3]|nr:hypothetical protein Sm713_36960 [Streptomyces sp. TS71-3]
MGPFAQFPAPLSTWARDREARPSRGAAEGAALGPWRSDPLVVAWRAVPRAPFHRSQGAIPRDPYIGGVTNVGG